MNESRTGRKGRPTARIGAARRRFGLPLALAWAASVAGGGAPLARPAEAQTLAPDVIYHNGKIVTVDERFSIAEAVAVRGDRVIAVGSDQSVLALAGPSTRQVDLGGKTVLPGIYDNHIHVGASADTVTKDWSEVHTLDQLEAALRARAAEVGPRGWVIGRVDRFYWPNDVAPPRDWLDRIVPDRPVAVTRGHLMMLNSAALRVAGIDASTPDPEGGWIVRDEKGEPTGHLYESPAKRLVTPHFPKAPPLSREEQLESLRAYLSELLTKGYTSVNVPGVRPAELRLFQEAYERWGEQLPRLTLQVRVSPGFDSHDDLQEGIRVARQEIDALSFRTGFGNDRLKLGAIKMSIDGGVSAPSFWSLEPYKGREDFTGVVRIPEEALYAVGKHAHDRGWQLGIHAIGDGAVVMAVDVLERILRESPREDHRHYLHHVSVKPPDATIRKMADLGITVASQPAFNYWLGSFLVDALEGERLETNNPQASLLRAGVRVTHGTDDDHDDPWYVMWAAVTRTGWGDVQRGRDQEAMTVEQAIRAATIETAWMTFDEDERGSLEVGKYADFIVLLDDVLTIDPARIRDVRVERTVVGGREVFVRDAE